MGNTESIIRIKRKEHNFIDECVECEFSCLSINYDKDNGAIFPTNRNYMYLSKKEIQFLIDGLSKTLSIVTDEEITQANNELVKQFISESTRAKEESKIKTREKKKGYVYFIKDNSGYIKIGCTKNVNRRLKDFSVASINLKIVHQIETNDMELTEELFHNKFFKKRIKGEWFNLNENDIEYIISNHYSKKIMKSINSIQE